MKKITLLITLIVLTTIVSAQGTTRNLKNFTAVNISSAFEVDLVKGEKMWAI